MKLSDYDDKCVRITFNDGTFLEGACVHDPKEFCETELGIDEECLEIADWLFKKSEIAKVELIDENDPFLTPFGMIEEEKIKEGADEIFEFLFDGDPRNSQRLLACIEHNLKDDSGIIDDRDAVVGALKEALNCVLDDGVRETIKKILSITEGQTESHI